MHVEFDSNVDEQIWRFVKAVEKFVEAFDRIATAVERFVVTHEPRRD